MKNFFYFFATGIFLILLAGCKTDSANSGYMASVEISNHRENEIRAMTAAVFLSKGYEQTGDLVFEKRGTAWDTAAYGSWSSSAVWVRMRVNLEMTDNTHCTLGCDAYQLLDRDQSTEMREQKFFFEKRSICKKLLDEVKAQLDSLNAASTNKIL
jgi:hypothetical protein